MPLAVIVRKDTGTLWIVGTVKPAGAKEGRRIRQRAGTDDPALAAEEARSLEAGILRDFHLGERPSVHRFSEAVVSYLTHAPRSAGTQAIVRRLLLHFRDRPLGAITQEAVDKARPAILRPGAGPSTWRRTVAALAAVLNHAERRGWCEAPRFDMPPEPKGRTAFLLPGQYEALEASAAPHLRPLLRYLICTGSRLGEALVLEWSQVDLPAARVRVWADQTKAKRERVVTLPPGALAALARLPHRDGRVFLTNRGEPYRPSDGYGGQIKSAWASALAGAGLSGFGPHDLRHSWASWWYALTPDPFRLQREGGWSSVDLVARYAHLMPAGHEAGIRRVWGTGDGLALVLSA